jgi:16S rRNA (guanine527-N7)-methyltransferase
MRREARSTRYAMTVVAGAATTLESGLARLRVALPPGGAERLAAYLALLAKWNRTYNLTAIREPERMVTHHALDSLAVVGALPTTPGLRILDVGSGGGLPGIPIAIARPDASVVLIDASGKKATFLAQAAIELPLRNVEAVAARVEDYAPARPFDVVISRAFADLATFVRVARRHVAPGGALYAMKGVRPDSELAALPDDVELVATTRLDVPGLDGERHLCVLRPRSA